MHELGYDDCGNLHCYKSRTMGFEIVQAHIIVENKIEHRVIAYVTGITCWSRRDNKKIHRESGPAIENIDGKNEWYYNGRKLPCSSQEEFERLLKLKAFW